MDDELRTKPEIEIDPGGPMGTDGEKDPTFLEVNINRVVRIWSAWLWRWLLLGWGPPILFHLGEAGLLFVVAIVGAPLGAYFGAFHLIFDKNLGEFRIRLEKSHARMSPSEGLEFLAPTRQRTQKIWNSWAGRSVLWGFVTVVACLAASVVFLLLGLEGTAEFVGILSWVFGFFAWLAASLFVLKPVLVKDYGEFRIRLVRSTTS